MVLDIEKSQGRVILTFQREKALNALNPEMIEALYTAIDELSQSPPTLVLLKGEGKHFMAGGDVKVFASALHQDFSTVEKTFFSYFEKINDMILKLYLLPCPTVSYIEGTCAGFGLSMMLACDYSLAHSKAHFLPAYLKLGLTPDGGLSFFLQQGLGTRRALEFLALKDAYSSEELKKMGLVTEVIEGFAEVDAFLHSLCKLPIAAYSKSKHLIKGPFLDPLKKQLQQEAKSFVNSLGSEDFKQRLTSFLKEKV